MSAHRIYFAQHGLALSKSDNPERPLSEVGIKQTKNIAKHIHSSGIPVSQIFHSGKLRTLQTADIIAATLDIKTVSAIDHLSPNDEVRLITQNLNTDNALYIGHLPHLEKLVSFLVTADENQNILKFQNSAIVCLEKVDNLYHVRWYLTPDLISNSPAN